MGRLLAIDFGMKRCGIAVSDPLQIIPSPLKAIETKGILDFLKDYTNEEEVSAFILGKPIGLNNDETDSSAGVKSFSSQLSRKFPQIPQHWVDERFTSVIAKKTLLEGGFKKKDRRNKGNVDKISAVLILQSFMASSKQ